MAATKNPLSYGDWPEIKKPEVGELADAKCPVVGSVSADGDVVLAVKPISGPELMRAVIAGIETEPDVIFQDHSRLPLVVWAIKLKRRENKDEAFDHEKHD